MRNFKDAKNIYDHIVIPEELDSRLRDTLENAPKTKRTTIHIVRFTRWASAAAAAMLLCFTIGLNTNEAFAMDMHKLPVIGAVAKVLTIRSYETIEDNTTTTVEIPEVQLETPSEEIQKAVTDVNAKIQSLIDEYTALKHREIEEYKEAFLSEGGTEEEWQKRSIDVNVDYEVKHQSETILSLLINPWISWFNFEEERHFYNIDLVTGKELTLPDLLGEDAYEYAEDCVLQQMRERIAEDPENIVFWGINEEEDMGNVFIGVTEETSFYINIEGNVVISYQEYEVAPGFMGIQEFIIPAR